MNPYDSHHTPLKRARLPVPPLPLVWPTLVATFTIILIFFKMSIPFLKFLQLFFHFTQNQRGKVENSIAKGGKMCYNDGVNKAMEGYYADLRSSQKNSCSL